MAKRKELIGLMEEGIMINTIPKTVPEESRTEMSLTAQLQKNGRHSQVS